ncbi:MAG: Rne/Rng family ribonuclease [Blastocatellia bacterium]
MAKEMIISVNGREKKIAIIEDDVVTEFYVERGDENQGIVGNIYKGKVMKVLPGMQSAFVDIGLERDSFLYVSDFFDEDMEDEDIEKKEIQRPAAQKIERPQRPPIVRPSRAAEMEAASEAEAEEEFDPHLVALHHIEEISAEPVIEPAPDDEAFQASEERAEGRSPRQRRQKRLRYSEPETAVEEVAVVPEVEQVEEESTAETETEEDAVRGRGRANRGRGRGRGGRGRGEEAQETPAAPVTPAAPRPARKPALELLPSSSGQVLVHHEPFERVSDDDNETAGDMLRDAMMQERIAGLIHEEERKTSILEFEPTPEIHVGGLQQALAEAAGFERISDGEDAYEPPVASPPTVEAPEIIESPAVESPVEEAEEAEVVGAPEVAESVAVNVEDETAVSNEDLHQAATQPLVSWQTEPEALPVSVAAPEESNPAEAAIVEMQSDVEVLSLTPTSVEFGEVVEAQTQEEVVEAVEELKEASAKVRGRSRRGEMATRRGGRGRRRTFTKRTTTDATGDAEDQQDDQEDDGEDNNVAPAPVAPVAALPARSHDRGSSDRFHRPVISDLLREGQEIIVQIAKEPIGQKGARITSHVALPGRYIVYMPTVEHIGVSRKIGTDEERQRLRRNLHQMRAEAGAPGGFIVRTAASGCTLEELREDMNYLIRTWTDIRRRSERAKPPAIVHRDLDLVQRILRDQLSQDYTAIRCDNELEYERIVDFVNRFAPKLVNRVKLYTKDTPILDAYGVQPEVDKAVKPRVWLKSGGYIVINQTEALVAIDVNTGKFVGKSNRLEDTITKTNLEAAKEIVRQIRLRDLGGIIVLDFIDMEERRNRQKVMQALEQEIRSDRSPSKILQFNDFGLVAVTRKRVKQSLERTLCSPCSYCGGGGMVKSTQTVCYEILAEARRIAKDIDDTNEVILRVNPEVAKALRGAERDVLNEIEAYLGGIVSIKSDQSVHQEQFDIALA